MFPIGAAAAHIAAGCVMLWAAAMAGDPVTQVTMVWVGLSLLLGAFAPASLTGGDCAVGRGAPVTTAIPRSTANGAAAAAASGSSRRGRTAATTTMQGMQGMATTQGMGAAAVMVMPPSPDPGVDRAADDDDSNLPTPDSRWSTEEDMALLAALKAHPKDATERWDKVAEAVNSKSKSQCYKRYSQLRDDFRRKAKPVSSS